MTKTQSIYQERFISCFEKQESKTLVFLIHQGLIKNSTIRNYCLVIDLKELQFIKNYSFAKSVQIISKKYSITTRRVREIYNKNMHLKKPF